MNRYARILPFIKTLAITFAFICLKAHAYDPADTFIAKPGNMPLILTVPHDGENTLSFVSTRMQGATVRDAGTQDLAERTAELIEQKTGKRPYIVIAKINRKYLDVNRNEKEAFESPNAEAAYRAYHSQVAQYVAEVKDKFPSGALLIDVHGQSDAPDTIFFGTGSGLTVQALHKKFGDVAMHGESSIALTLEARGYQVFPPTKDSGTADDPRFNGGFTVRNYGSNKKNGIDAIQLEFGRNIRAHLKLPEDFEEAIVQFMSKYIP